jgi:hypothetical protein
VKCQNGKGENQLELPRFQNRRKGDPARIKKAQREWAEGQRQDPHPLPRAQRVRTRKIKSRAKTSQLQDELPEWVHRGRRGINEGKHGCEKVGHPPNGWATRQ